MTVRGEQCRCLQRVECARDVAGPGVERLGLTAVALTCTDVDKRLCETCPWIPPSRLDVMPHARLCVQTKEIEERKKQR